MNRKFHYPPNVANISSHEISRPLTRYSNSVSVLIPSYTIRFSRKDRHRPLGIAYAEFKTPDQIEAVVREFDGTVLKNRKMSVKKHYPYNPRRRNMFKRPNVSSPIEPNKAPQSKNEVVKKESKPVIARAIENNPGCNNEEQRSITSIPNSELSNDTVYIPKVHGKVTDENIRDFFKDYSPAQIYIFRDKPKRGPINLKGSYVSVLAKVDSSQTKLEDIISNLKAHKLNGRRVSLQPALKTKVEEASLAASRARPLLLTSETNTSNDRNGVVNESKGTEPTEGEASIVEESN